MIIIIYYYCFLNYFSLYIYLYVCDDRPTVYSIIMKKKPPLKLGPSQMNSIKIDVNVDINVDLYLSVLLCSYVAVKFILL